MLGLDPDRHVHCGAQAAREGAGDGAQVHARLRDAVVALVQIERAADVIGLRSQRDAPAIAERLRHAGPDLDLLAQAGVGAPTEPTRDPAQRARQQHGRLVAAVVAQPHAEAAARALAQQHREVALVEAVPNALEQTGGVQTAQSLVQRAPGDPAAGAHAEGTREKPFRHATAGGATPPPPPTPTRARPPPRPGPGPPPPPPPPRRRPRL